MKFSLLSLFFVLWTHQLIDAQTKPWFCGEYECPTYTSTSQGTYSVRTYPLTHWLTTSVVSRDTDANMMQKMRMFWNLFPYFNRRNSARAKLQMGVPGLTKVEKRDDGKFNITMMFWVNSENPPTPNSRYAKLVDMPAGEVYVKEFPMYAMPSDVLVASKAKDLSYEIADKNSFNADVFYSVSYSYPFTTDLKQYEVWMTKTM